MSSVSPGYVFTSSSDPITYSKLNLLATPTVTVGTSEIITAMIADNSVTVAKLAQATGGGFLGRTAATLGDISFITLSDGTITWPTYGMAIGNASNATEFTIGKNPLERMKLTYGSVGVTVAIAVGGSGTTNLTYADGATTWTGGAFTYNLGNGTSSATQVFQMTLTGGSVAGPVALITSVLCTGGANGFGFLSGNSVGGTVTQGANKTDTVVLSKHTGQITMSAAALNAGVIVSFTLTNTLIAAGDILSMNHVSGGTIGSYTLNAQCAAGSATINVRNATAGNLSEAVVIGFVLIKGATN